MTQKTGLNGHISFKQFMLYNWGCMHDIQQLEKRFTDQELHVQTSDLREDWWLSRTERLMGENKIE